jgi:hypothetical protein
LPAASAACAEQRFHPAQRLGHRRVAHDRALQREEMQVANADGAEHRLQVRREEVGLPRPSPFTRVAAARRHGDVHRPVREQADLASGREAEAAVRAQHMVDPGLQHRGHRVVVHRRADDHRVGRLQLADQPLGLRQRAGPLVGVGPHRPRARQRVAVGFVDVRQADRAEVAPHHGGFGRPLAQPLDDALREVEAERRVAARAGRDVQDVRFHRAAPPQHLAEAHGAGQQPLAESRSAGPARWPGRCRAPALRSPLLGDARGLVEQARAPLAAALAFERDEVVHVQEAPIDQVLLQAVAGQRDRLFAAPCGQQAVAVVAHALHAFGHVLRARRCGRSWCMAGQQACSSASLSAWRMAKPSGIVGVAFIPCPWSDGIKEFWR